MVTNTVSRSGPPTTWTSPCLMMYISRPISPCNTQQLLSTACGPVAQPVAP